MSTFVAGIVSIINTSFVSIPPGDTKVNGVSPKPVPVNAPFPYVTVSKLSSKELENLEGPSGMSRSIMQIEVWDHDYDTADRIRTAIRDILLAWTGAMPNPLLVGLSIAASNHSIDAEFYDSTTKLHQAITRLVIHWET